MQEGLTTLPILVVHFCLVGQLRLTMHSIGMQFTQFLLVDTSVLTAAAVACLDTGHKFNSC